jgi:phytoene dehydrogenase-like protein
VELVIPSTIDGTLAPRGQHVASLFCQHVAPKLSDGSSWDDHRETVADLMIETVNDHAPNFRRSVLARQIFSPLDLERTFELIGGDIFHGALDLRQIFSARPMLGHADYRGPNAGLYLCGSGGHPEAASPARQATMPLGKSCVTSSASASPGFDKLA